MSPRQVARAPRAGRWSLILAFALSIALAGCTLPGRRVESSTATAVGVAVASPVGTAATAGSPPPLAAAAPTAATPATPAVASPRPATPSPTAGTPAAGRGTASPGGGTARSLKDNPGAYLEPPQWQRAYAEEIGQNTIIGPGFNLAIDEPTGKFYLHDVYPNTPAAAAGLKAGDIIVQVGGRPAAKGTGNNALFDLLTGPVGTSATLQVTRPSTGQTVNARVTVAEVEVPLITSRVLPGGIGYLRLRNFSNNAGEEFDKALAALQAQGITALIFDVRQNPGGSVDALKHILSHFTHQGPLAVTYDENKKRAEENPDPSVPLLGLPWLVLCDNGSASSSDITSAVAKDRGGHL